ncbi:MAG TPA: GreA/GreB family elongation factor [Steroidobacteraceae bacterium]|jgi:regulator of nucleoside diphosphate kinase
MESTILLRKSDLLRLRSLLGSSQRIGLDRHEHDDLFEEIDRATVVEDDALPADVAAIGSTVLVLDVDSGAHDAYTLVFPAQADISRRRVSVLAPLGIALLGSRVGDVVEWSMPGGVRRLSIEAVQHGDGSSEEPTDPFPGKQTRLAA